MIATSKFLINNPLTTELNLYLLEVLFRLVTPFSPVFSFLLWVNPRNLSQSFFHVSFTSSWLWLHPLVSEHSIVRASDQRVLLLIESRLKCQKWSSYKTKRVFSRPVCARKQNTVINFVLCSPAGLLGVVALFLINRNSSALVGQWVSISSFPGQLVSTVSFPGQLVS